MVGRTGRERESGDKALRSVCPFVCVSPCRFSVAEEAAAAEGGSVGRGGEGTCEVIVARPASRFLRMSPGRTGSRRVDRRRGEDVASQRSSRRQSGEFAENQVPCRRCAA
jgi:hypothetical protein